MSRSASSSLYVEGGSRAREIRAEEIYEAACEEGRSNAHHTLPIWGDDTTFHWNSLLLNNCIQSQYFQKCCLNLTNYNMIIDEIYYEVKSLNVFVNVHTKQPSTAFCLLLRLLTIRMNEQQLIKTLQHVDSPYIRAIGFLYLRFVGIPETIYRYIQPYLYDNEELMIDATTSTAAKQQQKATTTTTTTIGTFVRTIFQSRDYYGQTTLPRYPILMERSLHVKLLAADKIYDRAVSHYNNPTMMQHLNRIGNRVMALYNTDDDNNNDGNSNESPSQLQQQQWYEAEIDRIITRDDETDTLLLHPKFVITYTQSGITKTVTLGELNVIDTTSTSSIHGYREQRNNKNRYTNGTDDKTTDLYDEVRRREREQLVVTATGSKHQQNHYHRHYNHNSNDNRSERISGNRSQYNDRQHNRNYDTYNSHRNAATTINNNSDNRNRNSTTTSSSSTTTTTDQKGINQQPPKRNIEDMAVIAEKKRKLFAKYG